MTEQNNDATSSILADLDILLPQTRVIKFEGREVEIVDVLDRSVEDYLELSTLDERIALMKSDSKAIAEYRRVAEKFTSLTSDEIGKMRTRQLVALVTLLRATLVPTTEKPAEAKGAASQSA